MKRNLILTCLALISACGGDDGGGGGGDDSVADKKGKSLTSAERLQFCEAQLDNNFDTKALCDIAALSSETKDECEQSREDCLKFVEPSDEETSADPSTCQLRVEASVDAFDACTATLAELKTCLKKRTDTVRSLIGEKTCDNLTKAQEVDTPAECEKLPVACGALINL